MRSHCRSATPSPTDSRISWGEQGARRDLRLAGLDVCEVEPESLGVVLEEEFIVVLHGHGGDPRVHNIPPRLRRDEDLGELEGAAQGRERLAETLADAVGVVLVLQVLGEVRRRALCTTRNC
jgi:hypothetical protein